MTSAASAPEPDFARQMQGTKGVLRRVGPDGVANELAGAPRHQSVPSADPERAPFLLGQTLNVRAPQRGRVCLVENGEPRAVEARQPFLGSHPELTVAALQQTPDGILREALVRRPPRPRVGSAGAGHIGGGRRRDGGDQHHRQPVIEATGLHAPDDSRGLKIGQRSLPPPRGATGRNTSLSCSHPADAGGQDKARGSSPMRIRFSRRVDWALVRA